MPSLNLSKLVRRKPDRPTIKERAAALKAAAVKVLRRRSPDADQGRRTMVVGSLAAAVPLPIITAPSVALAGSILGTAPYKTGRDLTAVAEAWIADAADIGMFVVRGPDGNLWRGMAVDISAERAAAQDAHWHKLNDRPPLLRAVYAVVEGGGVTYG